MSKSFKDRILSAIEELKSRDVEIEATTKPWPVDIDDSTPGEATTLRDQEKKLRCIESLDTIDIIPVLHRIIEDRKRYAKALHGSKREFSEELVLRECIEHRNREIKSLLGL